MTCYLRNGTESPQAIACDHGAVAQGKHTGCCNPGDLCLSNGLCRSPNVNELTNYAWFFGCTDNTFTDSACGNFCDEFQTQNHELAFQCPQENTWCCHKGADTPQSERVNRTNTECCSVESQVFKAPWATVIATASHSGTPVPVATLMPGTSSQSQSHSSSAATSSPGSLDNPGFRPTGKSTSALAIGLGVGLGGAAVVALVLGWMFLRRRRKRGETPTELHGNNENEERNQVIAEKYGVERLHEMDSRERYELHSPIEKKTTSVVYGSEAPMEGPVELPATELSRHEGIKKL